MSRYLHFTSVGVTVFLANFLKKQNIVSVTLVKRDPNIEPPFQICDIDFDVKYRIHRNFNLDGLRY